MFTAESLIDIHSRTHQSLGKLVDHCAGFRDQELMTELEGFGYPSIRLQLHHAIGGERYWVGVLLGFMLIEERKEDYESIEALRVFRVTVAGVTADYLRGASEAELNTPRAMTTWGGQERELVPGRVILRAQTHIFQHQGQVAAMARLLGRPIPEGLDFPVD